MIAIDTNVLVRYLTQDDQQQAKIATKFINEHKDAACIFINLIVLCELVWVLETAYNYHRNLIASVLEKILCTKQFKIENLAAAEIALKFYRTSNVDFSDYLIAENNRSYGCCHTVSFDKDAIRSKAFIAI